MKIERTVDPKTGATTDKIILSDNENAALDQAHEIIQKRAEAQDIAYDRSGTEFWLLGIMRFDSSGCPRESEEDGIRAVLDRARHAAFQEKPQRSVRGYA